MKKIIIGLMLLLFPFVTVEAQEEINVYVFYGNGCTYCERLLTFMNHLDKDDEYNSKYELVAYEVWSDSENIKLKNAVGEYFEYDSSGVPFYIIGEKYFVGYSEEYDEKIKNTIDFEYNNKEYKDIVAKIIKDNNLSPNERKKTTYTVDTTYEENTIERPSTVKSNEELIEDNFNDFIYDLNEGGKEIFNSIDIGNDELEKNIRKYIKKINVATSNTIVKEISKDKYLLKTTINAEGDNWSISGIRVEFTYEKRDKGFVITKTNLFDYIGTENIFKLIKWIFMIVIAIILVIVGIIVLALYGSKRSKKNNQYSSMPPQE